MGIRTGETPAGNVRDQRARAEFYENTYRRALDDILGVCHRDERTSDFVEQLEDIERIIREARSARW